MGKSEVTLYYTIHQIKYAYLWYCGLSAEVLEQPSVLRMRSLVVTDRVASKKSPKPPPKNWFRQYIHNNMSQDVTDTEYCSGSNFSAKNII